MLEKHQVSAYLDRIQYDGSLGVSEETLRGLHSAHVFRIPFEDLDIHLGRKISLLESDLYNKIVTRRRGGYCFEMNGLFALILEALGFEVRRLFGRVIRPNTTDPLPRTHQVLLVTLGEQRWVADVGCGGNGLIEPILLEHDQPQKQYSERFRLLGEDSYNYTLQCEVEGQWESVYTFTLEAYLPIDYKPTNHYTSTYPETIFVRHKFCTMPTPEGRNTLFEMDLKIRRNGQTQETTLASMDEFHAALKTYFDLEIEGEFIPNTPSSVT